jgi:CRP/FNR family transcriptional regulator
VASVEALLKSSPLYRSLAREDLERLATVSLARRYEKGESIFAEGDPSDHLFTIASGRVKIVKLLPAGKEVILEIFGAGDPLGAVVAYEGRPYPASAVAMEDTVCIQVRRAPFFALLENHPSLLRGYLVGMANRLVELTRRIAEVTSARVETRFARLFVKLSERMGQPVEGGRFIPMPLSRQELADLTGTTLETAIRVMSRWAKTGVVETSREGFLVKDGEALERIGQTRQD